MFFLLLFSFLVAGASCSLFFDFLTYIRFNLQRAQETTWSWVTFDLNIYKVLLYFYINVCTFKWHWHNTLLWNLFIRSFGGFPLWLNATFCDFSVLHSPHSGFSFYLLSLRRSRKKSVMVDLDINKVRTVSLSVS